MDDLAVLRRRAREAAARLLLRGSGQSFVMMTTGGRDYRNGNRLKALCDAVRETIHPIPLFGIAGGASGADRAFEYWCTRNGVGFQRYPAKWSMYRNAAGPIRNQVMIDEARPDFYLAVGMTPDSGTQDCVEKAKLAGILGFVDGPDFSRDRLRLESGQIIAHHALDVCTAPCSIHFPSSHHMRNWPRLWRSDSQLMERTCLHGVGHPDPDDLAYKARQAGDEALFFWQGIHGCDGCCEDNKVIEGEIV